MFATGPDHQIDIRHFWLPKIVFEVLLIKVFEFGFAILIGFGEFLRGPDDFITSTVVKADIEDARGVVLGHLNGFVANLSGLLSDAAKIA